MASFLGKKRNAHTLAEKSKIRNRWNGFDIDDKVGHAYCLAMSTYFPSSHVMEETFTASEAFVLTDVNPPVQRNWRRRGLLPKDGDGWARLSPQDLFHVSLREAMGQLGLPHLDPRLNLGDLILEAQAWAATCPSSIAYMDGLEPELHPHEAFFRPPRFRYAWASTPWREGLELSFATDLRGLEAALGGCDGKLAAGLALIDLKAIGLGVAERANVPLWAVRAGPGMWNIVDAQNAAANGDKAAQQALEAIGVEWDASKL